MLWIASEKSTYIPQNLPKTPTQLEKNNFYHSYQYNFNQNYIGDNYHISEEIDNCMYRNQSYLIMPQKSGFGSFINIYSLNVFNQKIANFFLHYQKKLPFPFRCMDISFVNFGDCCSELAIASGTARGEVVLWELEDEENTEFQCIYGLSNSKQKYSFSVNCLSWNKVARNLILTCSKDKQVRCIDIKSEKCYNLIRSEKFEPLYLKCNPFNNFEYVVLLENFSYFIADRRCKKGVVFFMPKKQLKSVNWFFSENHFLEIEKNGGISVFDKRYITQKKSDCFFTTIGISGKISGFDITNQFDKILLINQEGSLAAWKSTGRFDYLSKMNINTSQKYVQKAVWSSFGKQDTIISLDKNLSISLVF